MADIKYYDVILKPVITEKSMAGMGEKKYTFLVHPEANKTMIKEAVEKMFPGTKVESVNTMNAPENRLQKIMIRILTLSSVDPESGSRTDTDHCPDSIYQSIHRKDQIQNCQAICT